ncbi:tRNA (guanosine(46)-N7)-methyltransferase TrmB [Methylocystis heyeri]|uniref:tRNA (guanosine(46)-N7)-methyltransferase TrmB n=1 Tax=Methylocystis heyeri TaxID=391905 RepID=UPI00113C77CB|nr:tRNA (guanosine(46)-N7)-methyltransferase TrmB [Methylocystis heyeri]
MFGRSKGKALRKHQTELVSDLLPELSLDLSGPLDPATLFAEPMRETRLEIGFGGGEHLIEAADKEPDVGFIGCEPFVNGVARLLSQIEKRGLKNIKLHRGDAIEAVDRLPDASLSRVYLFYPDPWPKRRQRKRRFVSEDALGRLARVMKKSAELRFATDIDDYAAWTLARVNESPDFQWTAQAPADWLVPWQGWTRTKYEGKAIAAGRKPVYLSFMRG